MVVYVVLAIICLAMLLGLLLGAPFVPTRVKSLPQVLRDAGAQKGDVFYDLGFGSGTVLLKAAQMGLVVRGYEINPLLWFITKLRLRGVDHKLNYGPWQRGNLADADFVFIFTTTHHAKSVYLKRLPEHATVISFGPPITAFEQSRSSRELDAYTIYDPVVHKRKKR